MKKVIISGTGRSIPRLCITNEEISKYVDTNDQWIVSRTGISERRICQEEEAIDLAVESARKALKSSGINAGDIDMIIVATMTADMSTPSMACMVQKEIGASKSTAFDINAACTGFIFALSVGESFISSGKASNALVVGVDTLSKYINWQDRTTSVLFGDGAGAAILATGTKGGIEAFYTKSYGDLGCNIEVGGAPIREIFTGKPLREKHPYISMNGKEVFKFASFAIIDAIENVLDKGHLSIDDIDLIIPHQANKRIIEYASKKMKQPIEKFYMNMDKFGNTSSASVAIALDEAMEKKIIKKGQKVILTGFGGGLTAGAVLVEF